MRSTYLKIAVVLLLAVLTVYLFPHHDLLVRYNIEKGRPWGYESVTAEFDFPVYKTDEQLSMERDRVLREDLAPCFTRTGSADYNVISFQDFEFLQREGYQRISVLSGRVSNTYPIGAIYTPKTAYKQYGRELPPTLSYDSAATRQLREQLLSSISLTQGMVQSGEKIIDRGDIVTDIHEQKLVSLRRAFEEQNHLSRRQRIYSIAGDLILVGIFLLMFCLYLYVFRPRLIDDMNNVFFFALLPVILISSTCLELRFTSLSIYLIPFAWVPVLTRIFFDSRTALFLHLTTIFICSLAVGTPFEFLVVQTAVGMVAVASLKDLTRRSQLTQTAGWILLTYVVVYSGFRMATTGDIHAVSGLDYLYFVVNAALVICSYGLVYLFERVFKLLSSITLVELMDINSSLLRDFADHAPGSFQHSLQVSNLATDAAKEIGANGLLVRTGALYHDIGKSLHPEFFTENQQEGVNPLNEMSPAEAARIIISHVADGVDICRRNHLPDVLVDFVRMHHGLSLTRYFYNTALNDHRAHPDTVPMPVEDDFRYPGPLPETRETAIIMMADAVEARSRSLHEYTEQTITEMVNDMIDQQVAEGQFALAPISFRDITLIKQVFVRRLITINHHRIKYPTLK